MARARIDTDTLISLLQHCVRVCLSARLSAVFDEFEARLFELAECSRDAARQHAFFDGMRESRRHRADVEHDFIGAAEATLRLPDPARPPALAPALALVAHQEFEETMALASQAERFERRLREPLLRVERRLDALLRESVPEVDGPRLGPQALGRMFRSACRRLDIDFELRLILLAIFAQHVFAGLEATYARLDAILSEAGAAAPDERSIAPPRARARRETPTPRGGAERGIVVAPPSVLDLHSLQALFEQVRSVFTAAGEPASSEHRSPPLDPDCLTRALAQLAGFGGEPREVKVQLLGTARRLQDSRRAQFAPQQEQTIDLLGSLFDFVRHDAALPEPTQAVLARLHLPFLHIALHDPRMIEHVGHPALRLFDALGEMAFTWSAAIDPQGHELQRLQEIVERVSRPASKSAEALERALQDLQVHLDVQRRRAELAEQRTVEAALGRERLRIARTRVAASIEQRLALHPEALPGIRQLLRGPWANVLVLFWLRQGELGQRYREAVRLMDELLRCGGPPLATVGRAKSSSSIDWVEQTLRDGLEAVARHPDEIAQRARQVRQWLERLRRGQPAPEDAFRIDPELTALDFALCWQPPEPEDHGLDDAGTDEACAALQTQAPGVWFEFGPAGRGDRARLSWSSPFSGRLLFVHRTGQRAREASPISIARELRQGTSRMLDGSGLFQRALLTLRRRTIRTGQRQVSA